MKKFCNLLSVALLLFFFCTVGYGQMAKDTLSSGDKGYKLGCALAQRPCENSCGELWSPTQKKEQERRCDEHKKQQAECRKQAYAAHQEDNKKCAADKTQTSKCHESNWKKLDERLAACKK